MPPYRTPASFGNAKAQFAQYGSKASMVECSTCQRREGVVRRFKQGKYAAHMKRWH
jgi:hypothetical protein